MNFHRDIISLAIALCALCNPVQAYRRHPSFFNNNDDHTYDTRSKSSISNHQSDHVNDKANGHRRLYDGNQKEQSETSIVQETIESAIKSSEKRSRFLSSSSSPQPSDHLVTDLPYLDDDTFSTKHYAGHIPASKEDDKKIFYWLFEPDTSDAGTANHRDEDIPLLIWLNGGPGCSSMDGLFLENGPLRLVRDDSTSGEKWSIETNPYSWNKAPAYVLYVDQPVGTGLSFTKSKTYCKNDLEVNIDFHLFLENFLLMYQDFFLKDDGSDGLASIQRFMKRPLYFSGESHAGHYIPSMMQFILKRNDDKNESTSPRVNMNLRGAAIGNGWMDPYNQYAAADLAYSIGMIDASQKEGLDRKERLCHKDLSNGKLKSDVCFDLLDDIINDSSGQLGNTRMSIYDNRIWELSAKMRSFPPGHKEVESYLGGWHRETFDMSVDYEEVLRALHAEESVPSHQRYKECTDPPYLALSHQDGLGVTDEIVDILEHDSKPILLFFNGMNDMICNHIGNEKALDNLKWKHAKDWMLAKRNVWGYESAFVDGTTKGPVGYMKEFENLAFLKIASSGHMVPMDLPDVALEMMKNLMFQLSFGRNYQHILKSNVPHDGDASCSSCPTCSTSKTSLYADDDGEEADEGRKLFTNQFVFGGWFGGAIGVSMMILFNVWRSGRVTHRREFVPQREESVRYSDDPETEMVISAHQMSSKGNFV